MWEVLEDGALHCELVEISVQEGDDSFREGRGAMELHRFSAINSTMGECTRSKYPSENVESK